MLAMSLFPTRQSPWCALPLTLALVSAGLAPVPAPSAGPAQDPVQAQAEPSGPALPAVTDGDWPIFRGDSELSGVAKGELAEELDLLWTFSAEGAITSSPVVAGERLWFGSDDGKVYCLDRQSGAEHWSFETADMIEAPPLFVDGMVYVGSNDGWLYALDGASGELRWKAETRDKILGGANYLRDGDSLRIIVGSYDANLYAYDSATGELQWTYETDNYVNGTPAVHAGRAIFGGCDAMLHVVDLNTGERKAGLELGDECHVAGSAAFVDGRAYFGHYGNQFVCVDVDAGETVWTYDSARHPFFSSPSITADRVVFGGRDRHMHCVARADGKPLWTFRTKRKIDSSPVVCGDKVVFGSGDGRIYLVELANGELLWSYDVGKAILSSPAVVGGRVYLGANDGGLYCFGPAANGQDASKESDR